MGMLFFLSLFGYAFLIEFLLPEMKIGSALFCSFCGMVATSYVVIMLLGTYAIGAYIIIFGGLASLVVFGLLMFVKKRFDHTVLSPAMLLFIGFSLVSVLLLNGVALKFHDDFSFWGRAVRELYIFNQSYLNINSNMAHSDYNPAFGVLQYAVVCVFGWKNEYLFYVIVSCLASVLSMLVENFTWKKIKYVAAFGALLFVCYPIVDTFSILSLTIDGPMAMIFAGGLLKFISREDNSTTSLLPVIMCMMILPSLKLYSGLMFALCLFVPILFVFVKGIWKGKKNTAIAPTASKPPRIALVILSIVVILFSQLSWSAYYNYSKAQANYNLKIATQLYLNKQPDITDAKPVFSSGDIFRLNPRDSKIKSGFTNDELAGAIVAVKKTLLMFLSDKLNDTPFTIASSILLLMIGIYILHHYAADKYKKMLFQSCLGLAVAAVAYSFGIFIALMVQPGIIGDMTRYFGVIVLSIIIVFLYHCIGISAYSENKGKNAAVFCLLSTIIALLVFASPLYYISKAYYNRPNPSDVHVNRMLAKYSIEFQPDDRALIIDNTNDGANDYSQSAVIYCYQYELLPARVNAIYIPYGDDTRINQMTEEYLEQQLTIQRANKIVVFSEDSAYKQKLADILSIPSTTELPWILTVTTSDGEFDYSMPYPQKTFSSNPKKNRYPVDG